jgi:hypothetical protein
VNPRKQAELLRDSSVLRDIFAEAVESTRDQWETAGTVEQREHLHAAINAIRRLEESIYARIHAILAGGGDDSEPGHGEA